MWKDLGSAAYNFGKGAQKAEQKDLAKKIAKELAKKSGVKMKKSKSVSDEDMASIHEYIKSKTWDDKKISAAMEMGGRHSFSISQIRSLMKYATWDKDRTKIANACFDKCTNKAMFFKLESEYDFDSNKKSLRVQ